MRSMNSSSDIFCGLAARCWALPRSSARMQIFGKLFRQGRPPRQPAMRLPRVSPPPPRSRDRASGGFERRRVARRARRTRPPSTRAGAPGVACCASSPRRSARRYSCGSCPSSLAISSLRTSLASATNTPLSRAARPSRCRPPRARRRRPEETPPRRSAAPRRRQRGANILSSTGEILGQHSRLIARESLAERLHGGPAPHASARVHGSPC